MESHELPLADLLIGIFTDVMKIFFILGITTIMFYVHPLISSIIIILYEIWHNLEIITLEYIYIPHCFTKHMIILCIFVVIEYALYTMYSSYAVLTFTMIKINYIFIKTSLADMIYKKDLEIDY